MKKTDLTPEAFARLVAGRRIHIYGANVEGVGYLKLFRRMRYDVAGFIDSRPFPDGRKHGAPVLAPQDFLRTETADKCLVVIATKHRETRREAIEMCTRFGLERGRSLLVGSDLCDYLPTVEVVGSCNLRCMSCDMGLPGANRNKGLMSVETFRQVIGKMTREIPFMNSVCLYLWGEPLIHPDLPEMVRIASDAGLATEISTNLNNARNLERLIEVGPDLLVVPCSGIGKNYEITHTAGKWDVFRANLIDLRRHIDHYKTDVTVRIYYHLYKHNLAEDYDEVEGLARDLGYQFAPILANLFPGKILRHVVNGEPIPYEMQRANEMMIFDVKDQIAYAQSIKHKHCPAIKAFPTVRWDTTLLQCCNMTEPSVGGRYLELSLDDLVARREGNGFCDTCQAHGMHRFFDTNIVVEQHAGRREVVRTP